MCDRFPVGDVFAKICTEVRNCEHRDGYALGFAAEVFSGRDYSRDPAVVSERIQRAGRSAVNGDVPSQNKLEKLAYGWRMMGKAVPGEGRRPNGGGTMYWRKSDHRWCVAVSTPEGRKTFYAKSEEAAAALLREKAA